MKYLKIKIGIDNISMENYQLPNINWIPKIEKCPIKARFLTPPFKPLRRTQSSLFHLFLKHMKSYNDSFKTFLVSSKQLTNT